MPHDDLDRLAWIMRTSDAAESRRRADPAAEAAERARDRRRRRRSTIAAIVTVVVIAALAGGYVFATLTAPVGMPSGTAKAPVVDSSPAVAFPTPAGEFAVSVAGADEFLGAGASGILTASGGDAAKPMASISKLVTALVVLDRKPLGDGGTGPTITFDKAAHDLYDKYYVLNATIAAMPEGTRMSERDAIATMLVASASNYAEAVSTWAFGSQPAFVSAARSWLKKHGLTSTTFAEPTGLDSRNTSTPADLLALGKLVMADPALAQIVGLHSLEVAGLPTLSTTNPALGIDGVNGIKTGTLDDVGVNLLFSANVKVAGIDAPLQVVGVILGSGREQIVTDVRAWLDALRAGFSDTIVGEVGTEVGTYRTAWGSTATMTLGDTARLVTWSDAKVTAKMTTTALKTGRDGERIGTVVYTAGSRSASVPVVLKGTITKPTTEWRLTHPAEVLRW
ncbi:hypothetical protein GCM10027515_32240 [Schumannella luteola]|uniref:D-alanyl-D-alanine carboxypeptidase (Penicillin-binding protein 5/6) n=1 Tax=Schumannella luteola TaxID=472059 RepID=A0A852Y7P4_9MICO|nr:D-alanyl-D-alanine carboxypeptidase (penicillin-binding protein 5/6) [Schumannella luteola]